MTLNSKIRIDNEIIEFALHFFNRIEGNKIKYFNNFFNDTFSTYFVHVPLKLKTSVNLGFLTKK